MIDMASEDISVASRMARDFNEASSEKRRNGRNAKRSRPNPAKAPAANAINSTTKSGGPKAEIAINPANAPMV